MKLDRSASPKHAEPEASPAPGGVIGWLADRPWLFVVGAFAVLIAVWVIFFVIALKHPVRDVLKDPLPAPTAAPSHDSTIH